MIGELRQWAAARGYAVAVGRRAVVDGAVADVRRRADAGEFASEFGRVLDAKYRVLEEGGSPGWAAALVVFSIPRPVHVVAFETADGAFDAVVPPTYVRYTGTREDLKQQVAHIIPPDRLFDVAVPLKAAAARLGLVRYGRNNIAYAPGMGSCHQLVGFLADLGWDARGDADFDEPREPERLRECETCRVCRDACPTGAIPEDRFLLRAERCLTFHNEQPEPWPDWVPADAHNALVGCMACQERCPANTRRPEVVRLEPRFTIEETVFITSTPFNPEDAGWRGMVDKLGGMGLSGMEEVVGRNLRALLNRGRGRSAAGGSAASPRR